MIIAGPHPLRAPKRILQNCLNLYFSSILNNSIKGPRKKVGQATLETSKSEIYI